jgi:hypothetical protein
MIRNRYIKFSVTAFLILIALWVATPRVYVHNLLNHDHSDVRSGKEAGVKSASAHDCDFEKYNKPVYFSLFKFISGFIPQRQPGSVSVSSLPLTLPKLYHAISWLRGPPAIQ